MKLSVQHGVSVEKALEYIKVFLQEQCGDYPTLKGNLNLYVTLKDDENRNCPDNEKEYILSADKVIDVEMSNLLSKKDEVLEGWERYVSVQQKKVGKAQNEIDSAQRNLEMAEKKGLTEKTIESRKTKLAQCKTALQEAKELAYFVQILNKRVAENNIKTYFEKRKSNNSYSCTYIPYIIFENVDGNDWHFVGYQSRYETAYGDLREGLPASYKN